MASESSRAVVMPKFDMHTYTSILTTKELKEVITEYCISTDLHPRLPPLGLTMDKIPPNIDYGWLFTAPAMGEPSPTQKAIKKPDLKIVTAREKKDKQNLAKTQAKRTISITPLHHVTPKLVDEPITSALKNTVEDAIVGVRTTDVDKEVVVLSETLALLLLQSQLPSLLLVLRTRAPRSAWPLLMFNKESVSSFIYFDRSRLSEFDPSQLGKYRVDSVAYLVTTATFTHFTPSIMKAMMRARWSISLCQSEGSVMIFVYVLSKPTFRHRVFSQDELLKRHELHNHDHMDLHTKRELADRLKDLKKERDDWRETTSVQIRVLEEENNSLVAQLAHAEMDFQKIIKEFILVLVHRIHTSVGYRKSLAALVSPDVPAPDEDTTRPSTKNDNDVLAKRASLKEHTAGTAIGTSPRTTTYFIVCSYLEL
uniref:Transposase (Putative), gypsy type n=1 Tax=Tanacetum cinerariifolium TaxID=118510 RepID=A0A699HNP3_TANCI|nr:transposase (putative), gypsy type [Tanacetum cinerariifolium]